MSFAPSVTPKTPTVREVHPGYRHGLQSRTGRTQLVSYAGLYPKVYSSGTSVHLKPRLARGGGARIRKGLYMPACGQLRTNTRVACWARELIARGKTKMEAIGAIMRKQLQLMRGVLVSGVPYQDTRPKAFLTH